MGSNSSAAKIGESCEITEEQTISLFFIQELFNDIGDSNQGMLHRTWPYAMYYAKQLSPC